MRHIGSLPDQQLAQRFADYLLSVGVSVQAEAQGEQWAVWVRDEDQLDRAVAELDEFAADPDQQKYQQAGAEASRIRREQQQWHADAARRTVNMSSRWGRPTARKAPATIVLIAVSVVTAMLSNFGGRIEPVLSQMFYAKIVPTDDARSVLIPTDPHANIRRGELWRAVTPIFIHFGVIHLLFNMMWMYQLGVTIESRTGTFKYVAMVLAIAVVSNVAQCAISTPYSGGMSGVVYGLFGYVWIKMLFDPGSRYFISPNAVLIMMVWLGLGIIGVLDHYGMHVGNWAHGVGLAVGAAIAYVPLMLPSSKPK